MNKKKAESIIQKLDILYPQADTQLVFHNHFELLVSVMLSAQCTDKRVNAVTAELFKEYNTPEKMLMLTQEELEKKIFSCGFYKNKAKNIKLCAKQVIENFNGELPHTMNELLTLAGIGRKSANVIMLEAFGIAEGIAVDTHAKRISNRIGLSNESEPEKIEQDLIKVFPNETLKDINHLFMWLGRNTCDARNPHCDSCSVKQYCNFYKKIS